MSQLVGKTGFTFMGFCFAWLLLYWTDHMLPPPVFLVVWLIATITAMVRSAIWPENRGDG